MTIESMKLLPVVLLSFLSGSQANTLGTLGTQKPFQSTGSEKICTILMVMPNGVSSIVSVPAPSSWTAATCKAYGQGQSPYTNSYQLTCQFDTATPSAAFSFGTAVSIGSTAPAPASNCGW